MMDDDLLSLFWSYHRDRLLNFAVQKAYGNRRDAEDGLNNALLSLWQEVVEHFKSVSIEDRTDAKKAILPHLWTRIRYRVWSARRKSLIDDQPLGQSVLPVEALDDLPAEAGNVSTDAPVEKLKERLARNWNLLSDTEKQVIRLTVFLEPPMTDVEAAKEIGTTPGAVKARRCSALRKLGR